jgi:hypothetical protein
MAMPKKVPDKNKKGSIILHILEQISIHNRRENGFCFWGYPILKSSTRILPTCCAGHVLGTMPAGSGRIKGFEGHHADTPLFRINATWFFRS